MRISPAVTMLGFALLAFPGCGGSQSPSQQAALPAPVPAVVDPAAEMERPDFGLEQPAGPRAAVEETQLPPLQ